MDSGVAGGTAAGEDFDCGGITAGVIVGDGLGEIFGDLTFHTVTPNTKMYCGRPNNILTESTCKICFEAQTRCLEQIFSFGRSIFIRKQTFYDQ